MSSIGLAMARAIRRPRVRLVITGNELLPAGTPPHDYQIADANGPMLAALVERDGGVVDFPGLIRDDSDAILAALGVVTAQSPEAKAQSPDLIIVSGGSSVGIEDLAPMLRRQTRHPRCPRQSPCVRAVRPAWVRWDRDWSSCCLAIPYLRCARMIFFAGRAIRALGGRATPWPYRAVRGTLTRKISSPIGRLDYARVKFEGGRVEPLSIAGASLLSSTTRADGFVIVDQDSEGYAAGSDVEVWLYA
jgi:molybdopterin molybdotransferase